MVTTLLCIELMADFQQKCNDWYMETRKTDVVETGVMQTALLLCFLFSRMLPCRETYATVFADRLSNSKHANDICRQLK